MFQISRTSPMNPGQKLVDTEIATASHQARFSTHPAVVNCIERQALLECRRASRYPTSSSQPYESSFMKHDLPFPDLQDVEDVEAYIGAHDLAASQIESGHGKPSLFSPSIRLKISPPPVRILSNTKRQHQASKLHDSHNAQSCKRSRIALPPEGDQIIRAESSNPKPEDNGAGTPQLLRCSTCGTMTKTKSLLAKHEARHQRMFKCDVRGCRRVKGFINVNDLNRHKKSVHHLHILGSKTYKCAASGCIKSQRIWPRLDNFRAHVIRMHPNEDADGIIARSCVPEAGFYMNQPDFNPVENLHTTSLSPERDALLAGRSVQFSDVAIPHSPEWGEARLLDEDDEWSQQFSTDSTLFGDASMHFFPSGTSPVWYREHHSTNIPDTPVITVSPPTRDSTPLPKFINAATSAQFKQELVEPRTCHSPATIFPVDSEAATLQDSHATPASPQLDQTRFKHGQSIANPELLTAVLASQSVKLSMVTQMRLVLASLAAPNEPDISSSGFQEHGTEASQDNRTGIASSSLGSDKDQEKGKGSQKLIEKKAESTGDDEDEAERSRGDQAGGSSPDEVQKRLEFACPFFKNDPVLFAACKGVHYRSIDGLYRHHLLTYHIRRDLSQSIVTLLNELGSQRLRPSERWRKIYSTIFAVSIEDDSLIPNPYWLPNLSSMNIDDLVQAAIMLVDVQSQAWGPIQPGSTETPFHRRAQSLHILMDMCEADERAEADRRWATVRQRALEQLVAGSEFSSGVLRRMSSTPGEAQPDATSQGPSENAQSMVFTPFPGPQSDYENAPFSSRAEVHTQGDQVIARGLSSSPPFMNLNDFNFTNIAQQPELQFMPATAVIAPTANLVGQNSNARVRQGPHSDSGYDSISNCRWRPQDSNGNCENCHRPQAEHNMEYQTPYSYEGGTKQLCFSEFVDPEAMDCDQIDKS